MPPSEKMDSPIFSETQLRLTELEAKLASQEENNKQVLTVLNTVLQLIATMVANQTQPAQTQQPNPTATTSASRQRLNLKSFLPPNFDEQTKIQWAMTYMNSGRAQKWVNQVYHWEAIPANIGSTLCRLEQLPLLLPNRVFSPALGCRCNQQAERYHLFPGETNSGRLSQRLLRFNLRIQIRRSEDDCSQIPKRAKPHNCRCGSNNGFWKTG